MYSFPKVASSYCFVSCTLSYFSPLLLVSSVFVSQEVGCKEGESLGTNGCTWRRLPTARMIYGRDLLASGWNRNYSYPEEYDSPNNTEWSDANGAAFAATFVALNDRILPTPCGNLPYP
jgi:hypothetical protein